MPCVYLQFVIEVVPGHTHYYIKCASFASNIKHVFFHNVVYVLKIFLVSLNYKCILSYGLLLKSSNT